MKNSSQKPEVRSKNTPPSGRTAARRFIGAFNAKPETRNPKLLFILLALIILLAAPAWGADYNTVPVDRGYTVDKGVFSAVCVRCGESYTRPCDPAPEGDCMVGNIQRMLCPTCEAALQKWGDEKGYFKTDNWDDHLSYDDNVTLDEKLLPVFKAYPTTILEATR